MKLKEIKNQKEKILLTAAYVIILLVFYFMKLPCMFLTVTHIPCILCGMTRAYLSLFALDIRGAFSFHPMFWSLPVLYLYFVFDGKLFKNEKINKSVLFIIIFGFLLNWVVKTLNVVLF